MTKEQAVKKAGKDCIFFGERYFKHLLTSRTGAFHRELIDIVEAPGKDRIDILAPRGHAKSTWLSIIYPIWKIANNRNIHILIVSDIAEQAEMFVQAIKNELEGNELLIEEFGVFRPKEKSGASTVWRSNNITVIRESRAKEPTVFSGGTGKKILGRRSDLTIADDPLNDENVESERQRQKTLTWFRKTLTPISKKNGRIIVIGTKKHPLDLHASLMETPMYACYRFKAINERGEALWPEEWSIETLMRKKEEVGSFVFAQEYQNEAIDEETALLQKEMLERNRDRGFDGQNVQGFDRVAQGWYLPLVVDNKGEFVIRNEKCIQLTIGKKGEDRYILSYSWEEYESLVRTCQIIQMESRRSNADIICISQEIYDLFRYYGMFNTELPIKGHLPERAVLPNYGLPNIMINLEMQRYHFPYTESSRGMTDQILKIMNEFDYKTVNPVLHAIWMCEQGFIHEIEEEYGKLEVIDDPA